MSLYLGKIHYWLFNKILWFEGLEHEIIGLAKHEGLDIESIESQINLKYGEKLVNKNLEEIIDKSNIHGWLQGKIHSAEGRISSWTNIILKNDKDGLLKLEKIYINQGIKAAKEVKESKSLVSGMEIYNSINDYILDGMPCDRVNEVIESQEKTVKWKRRICVHKDIWQKEDVDVSIFYNLRSLWIKAFVNEVNDEFEYIEINDGEYMITLK
ncbi:MAG: hypothetical protein ACRC3Y_04530 [Romboutsia sp.]|uniref:hypothetical protein n=1 Tax=Romboutsia sp. TaxID=1965302 RepID=UPI003F2CE7DA